MSVKVKYCGLKTMEDYLKAAELGIDYTGFVFHPDSPRYIEPMELTAMLRKCRNSLSERQFADLPQRVGLFVNTPIQEIIPIAQETHLEVLQLYKELPSVGTDLPYWKVCRIKNQEDMKALDLDGAQAIVLDSLVHGLAGGSGLRFNWRFLENLDFPGPYFVAGGITVENIDNLLLYRPYGVDISSGIERFRGKKDHSLMEQLIKKIRTYQ